MGASGWAYYVPYQPNIGKVLQGLRDEVIRRGEYYKRPAFWTDISEDDYEDEDDKAWLRRMKSLPEPTTIEGLLEWNGEDGTRSIIDISGIAEAPDFGVAAPLAPQQLMELFGTDRPTRRMIEEAEEKIQDSRRRWEGTFVIVYKDGTPDEIFFTGYSGD